MALNYVTVTGTFTDGSNQPVTGTATFTPSAVVLASGIPVVTPAQPITAKITNGSLVNSSGAPLTLLATDNTLTIEGLTGFWYWTGSLAYGGTSQAFSFFLPHAPSTVDITALINSPASGGGGFTNPMTTLGDLIYENATPAAARLAGNTASTKSFLTQTGTGSVSAAPAWGTIASTDLAQPWQFHVKSYGAKGDGQVVTDGAMTNASAALACATSTPFAGATAGMPIHVGGAGGGTYTPLCTTIASKTDSGHVTLTANATSTVTNGIVYFGTDDTSAVQSAINAAVTYAAANDGYAEVLFDPVIYIIGGAPHIGGGTAGNAQITLPIVANTAKKVTLALRGTKAQSALVHWKQTVPQTAGAILACARNDGTNDATNGNSSVLGGPYAGYGAISSAPPADTWDNMLVVLDGVGALLPYNGTYGGFDFYGVAELNVISASCLAAAVPVTGGAVPSMSDPSQLTHFGPFGLRTPSVLNNANVQIHQYSAEGLIHGIDISEHATFTLIHCIYCLHGMVPYEGGGGLNISFEHMITGLRYCAESCTHAITPVDRSRMHIRVVDSDSNVNSVVNDGSNLLDGFIGVRQSGGLAGWIIGAATCTVVDVAADTGVQSAPSYTLGTAFQNPWWQHAWISLAGGTVTNVQIGTTSAGATTSLATSTPVTFRLPSGWWLKISGSVKPTTFIAVTDGPM